MGMEELKDYLETHGYKTIEGVVKVWYYHTLTLAMSLMFSLNLFQCLVFFGRCI